MRVLFLALLLANLALYGFIQLDRLPSGSADPRIKQQVNPDKIKLLSPQQLGRLRADKVATAPQDQCTEWGSFNGTDRSRVEAILEPLGLGKLLTTRTVENKTSYWIFIPPFATKAAADKRAAELKTKGIKDLYVVQDVGPQRNAISLGIFKTEETTKAFLATLLQNGVTDARSAPRTAAQTLFTIRNPQPAVSAKLEQAHSEFPNSELKTAVCDESP